jgi:hypothetical protein
MTRETYTLKHPVTVDGASYDSLSLRRPKARDLIKARKAKDELEQMAAMVADLAEVPPKVVQELDAEDFAGVGEVIGRFLPSAQT